jgi:hypothetical protein
MSILISTLITRLQSSIGDFENAYADKYLYAINDACRETYPTLFRRIENTELITGNILPPFNWTSTTALSLYSPTNAIIAQTTTAGLVRGYDSCARVLTSAGDGYLAIDSDNYPRLLDLMDKTIEYKSWVEPQNANDAFLTIIYEDADASGTTYSSTGTCPASVLTLLEKESLVIPDDITKITFKLRVHTNGKYAYFNPPRAIGHAIYEYLLPYDFQDGDVKQVWIQTSGHSDDACDDLQPEYGEEIFGWKIIDDGNYKYIRLPYLSKNRRLKLIGYAPLEDDADATTDTITLDDRYIPVLTAYAAYSLYEKQTGIVSSDSRDRYQEEAMKWLGKYEMMKRSLRKPRIPGQIRWSL